MVVHKIRVYESIIEDEFVKCLVYCIVRHVWPLESESLSGTALATADWVEQMEEEQNKNAQFS